LTVALRGSATVTVNIRSLAGDKHSGQYGGAAPDARLALIRALATLHDDAGDVAVAGLRRVPWEGATYTEEEFRELSEVVAGVPLQGTGTIGERIWSGPAITVIGFDAPPTDAPLNSVAGSAKAVLNLRVHPEQDAAEAQAALVAHLRAQHPFGMDLEVVPNETGNGFAAPLGGPAYDAAVNALSAAWGSSVELMAGGGSIPVVMALHEAVPAAEKLLFGATDGYSNIHAPNERVLIGEIEKAVIAMAIFLQNFGSARTAEPA
jgi:acetylornithine deacetylase/succinyl-diaminopimelate desuccinylase-like protein